jgi:hypothetical protein
MKGKYVYIFTLRRIKIFKLARKDTADRVQLRTRDDSVQSIVHTTVAYNKITKKNSAEIVKNLIFIKIDNRTSKK